MTVGMVRASSVIIEYVDEYPARIVGWLVDDCEWARWMKRFQRQAPPGVTYEWMTHDDFLDRFVREDS